MTTAQIMFVALAGMEDAQIKGGGGMMKREEATTEADMESIAEANKNFFWARKAKTRGSEINEHLKEMRAKQAGLKKLLDTRLKKLVAEDQRYR